MTGTLDVDGLMRTVPADCFRAWHIFFEAEKREQDYRTACQLAMQYNTSLLVAHAMGGQKLPTHILKAAEDFLGESKKTKRGAAGDRLSAEESQRRAAARWGAKTTTK